jgi:hypothetical protein
MIEAPEPQGEQGNPYLPSGPPEPLICEEFEGINTATLRPGVDDKQLAWCDTWMPLSRRNLRTMYGLGPKVFTASSASIVFFETDNIAAIPHAIVFLSDGSITAVNLNTNGFVSIAPAGTISNPASLSTGVAQYGDTYLIIVSQQVNGYFIWDGTTFYSPGGPVPPGTAAPGTLMPTGVGGSSAEIYSGRVWIGNGAGITFSAPGSIVDFSSAHGGGNFASVDSFLRVRFSQLKQTNGFLYLVADSSVNYISGVQTSGSPPVTTFTNQNADPESGSPWPKTVDVFNRNILFANPFGAQVSYGGAVTKISEMLDGVYNTVPNFGNLQPSAAKAIIFGKKCWILLLTVIDPISGQQANKLFLWNGKIWWAATQEVPLIYIKYLESYSNFTAYGTDGSSIYQLFAQPSTLLAKVFQSKLWDKPGGYQFTKFVTRLWSIIKYYSTLSAGLNIAIDNENSSNTNVVQPSPNFVPWLTVGGAVSVWTMVGGAISPWTASASAYAVLSATAVSQQGVLTGFTVTTNAADVALVSMMIHDEIAGYRG